MKPEHRLAAILFCDIVGYTATTQNDETEAARQIQLHRKVLETTVPNYNGEVLQYYGDGSLSIFQSVIDAVDCALEVQQQLRGVHGVPLRAGIHLGEIYFQDDQFIGDGINIAARIQSEASDGQVLISEVAKDIIRNKSHISLRQLGTFDMKNVKTPMTLFEVTSCNEPYVAPAAHSRHGKLVATNRIWLLNLVVLMVILTLWFKSELFEMDRNPHANNSAIAVLPFTSLSHDKEDLYLCEGLSDDIRSRLARVEGLDVKSRSSSETVQGLNLSAGEIGTRLNIEYLLEGSMRRSESRMLINLALIDVKEDRTVTPIDFDAGTIEELMSMEDDIVQHVIRNILPGKSATPDIAQLETQNFDAYKNYLLGRAFLFKSSSLSDFNKSEDYFRKAIELDPEFGKAYAGLSEVLVFPAMWGYADMNAALNNAYPFADKALAYAPDDASTQYILGTLQEFDTKFESALAHIQRAIELDPSNSHAYLRKARIELVLGHHSSAIEAARTAVKLDPLSPIIASLEPFILIRTGDLDDAIRACENALELFPRDDNLLFDLAEAYASKGQFPKALDILLSRSVSTADKNFMVGYVYAKLGNYSKANEVLEYLLNKQKETYVPPSMIGTVYYGLGDYENAKFWLRQESNYFMLLFGVLKPLWTDERFAEFYQFLDTEI